MNYQKMVGLERLELSHLAALEPKSSASTNSATAPFRHSIIISVQIQTPYRQLTDSVVRLSGWLLYRVYVFWQDLFTINFSFIEHNNINS